MLDRSPTLCSILCALGLFTGCASGSDAVEKRLSQLRDDIRRLQNDNDRVSERLEAVELRQAQAVAAQNAPRPAKGPETVSRPKLKVLHLTPDGESPGGDGTAGTQPGAEEPPIILKGQGKDLEIKQSAGGSSSRAAPREKPIAVSQNEGD